MSAPPVGTRVTEGTRCGTVVAHRPQGMVDVNFDDLSYPIRRPAANLVTLRGNPFPSRRNPDVKPVFLCAVLTPESRRELYKWWMSQPLAPEPLAIQRATHMTIKFKPSEAEFEAAPIGKEVTLTVIGWVANPDIQAVAVTPNGVTSTKAHPHVTFALREPSIPAKLSDSILDGTVKGIVKSARGPSLTAHVGWSDGKVYFTSRQTLSNPGPRGGLSSRERASLPDSAFALPGRRWPIPDRNHAKIAKTYMARGFGRHADYPQIQRAISDRFQMNPEPEPYDPDKEQFRAVVQGVYESLVSKELGIRRPEPFILPDGTRPDSRLGPDARRRLLSSAYAIATRQGQKHGWLQPGTQTPTERGVKASSLRARDVHHASTNRQDYEQTLGAVRKSGHFRVVQEVVGGSTRFVVQPRPTHIRIPEYRMTLEAAQADADKANGSFTRWNPRPVRMRRNSGATPRHYYVSTLRALVAHTLPSITTFPADRYGCDETDLAGAQTALGSVLTKSTRSASLRKQFCELLAATKNPILRKTCRLDELYKEPTSPNDKETPESRVHSNLKYLFAVREIKKPHDEVEIEPPAYGRLKLRAKSVEAALLAPLVLWVDYLSAWWTLHGSLWLRSPKDPPGTPDIRYVSAEQIDAHGADINAWLEAEARVRAGCDDFKNRFAWAADASYEQFYTLLHNMAVSEKVGLSEPIASIRLRATAAIKDENLKEVPAREISFRRFVTSPPAPIYRVTVITTLGKDRFGNDRGTRTDTRTVLKAGLHALLHQFRLDEELSEQERAAMARSNDKVSFHASKKVRVQRYSAWDYKNTVLNVPLTQEREISYAHLQVVDAQTAKPAEPPDADDDGDVTVAAGPAVYRQVLVALGEENKYKLPTLHVETFILGLPQIVNGIDVSPKAVSPEARTTTQDDSQDAQNADREIKKKRAAAMPDNAKLVYFDIEQVFTISYEDQSMFGSSRRQYRTIAIHPDEDYREAYHRVDSELREKKLPGLPDPNNPTLQAYDIEVRYVIYIRHTPRYIRRIMKAGSTIALALESTTRGFAKAGSRDAGRLAPDMNKAPTTRSAGRRPDQSYTSAGAESQGATDRIDVVYPSAILKHFFTVDPEQLQDEEAFLNSREPADPLGGDPTAIDENSVAGLDAFYPTDTQSQTDGERDMKVVRSLLSSRHAGAQEKIKESRVFLRNSPDNNWVPYRSRINASRRQARGDYDSLTGQFEKNTLFENSYDVYFTKNAGLAYLTILYFNNPFALRKLKTDLLEAGRVKAALQGTPFTTLAVEALNSPEYSERTKARFEAESQFSEPVPPTNSPSVSKKVAERTLLGKLFTFGFAEGVVSSMESGKKASEAGPRTIHPKPGAETVQGQRLLSMASASARPQTPQETAPTPKSGQGKPAETTEATQAPVLLLELSDLPELSDDFFNNPRRPGRRFR